MRQELLQLASRAAQEATDPREPERGQMEDWINRKQMITVSISNNFSTGLFLCVRSREKVVVVCLSWEEVYNVLTAVETLQ